MPVQKYNSYIEISPSFESVVDIGADERNANLWREYIVGDDMVALMEHLCESLGNENTDSRRSFWIHGSYGTGKSYAAIFVKHLMEEKPEVVDAFLAASTRLSPFRKRLMKCRNKGDYLVIWKTGCTGIRTGDMMLLEAEKAVYDALIAKYGDKAYLGERSLLSAVKEKLNNEDINWENLLETTTLGDDYGSVEELRRRVDNNDLSALQATATVIRKKGFGLINNIETFKAWIKDVIDNNGLKDSGIFFIWDEFTEYVANSDDHTVMQQLSEFTKESPLFMFYIVHRSQEMLDNMGKDRYQMITHRFHQTEFHVSPDAAYDLIAGSIVIRNGMESHWREARAPIVNEMRRLTPDMSGADDSISEHIDHLCPMHPMTVKLLSRVAESFAAAQRTMFRFMKDTSTADVGFVGYINKHGPDDTACWLTPEWLWDYFFTRESDFSDKDSKAAMHIRHYEACLPLVEKDENALRVFKTAMLLLTIMSSAKGAYGGMRAQDGISATVECLENCMAGVISKKRITDLLSTMEDSKVLLRDEAPSGAVRLQLPFKGGTGDDFDAKLEANNRKYTRYQMFSKDSDIAKDFVEKSWDKNDAAYRRMKIAVCCAEAQSTKARLQEVLAELDRSPYKLGLLIVTVQDVNQYMTAQHVLEELVRMTEQPRLTIALAGTPLTDEKRRQWLTSITKMEMASISGQTASANQYKVEAHQLMSIWVAEAVAGKMIAWNDTQVFSNLYGMPNLCKTIHTNVLQRLFPYAPETIVITNTAYRPCQDGAPLVGITRESGNSQLKSVLNGLAAANLLDLTTIDAMAEASGSKAAKSISELAKLIRTEMLSGQRVVLGDLWERLQQPPFGYHNTIACGILLGFVFSCYKDSAFSWTDSAQSTHVLGEATLNTMVLNMCKGAMTTDYLSAGSITYQNFRDYAKSILGLSDAQVANETECWHNMRVAVTQAGAPFWALKYLPDEAYGSVDFKTAAMKIVDSMQQFIAKDNEHESAMSEVIKLFAGRGKLRGMLQRAFQDKNTMASALRSFLFDASPSLEEIATKLKVLPIELSDKLQQAMQGAIYTWSEDGVKEKLVDIVSEYDYLDALSAAMGKVYRSTEDAGRDLKNLFDNMRISLAAIEKLNKPWFPALRILHDLSRKNTTYQTLEARQADADALTQYGAVAKDCLSNAMPVLSDILEAESVECTKDELDSIYVGLKDMSCDATLAQFDKELKKQISSVNQVRNRATLKERWQSFSGTQTVKEWCDKYKAPLTWVAPKEFRKAISTVLDVLRNNRTLDQDVQSAIATLDTMDKALLTDRARIEAAFLKTVGAEFKEILNEKRDVLMAEAKQKIGNDMSAWDIGDLLTMQSILKDALKEKAKREKLEAARKTTKTMKEATLRDRVAAFLDAHPEFCDFFIE